MTMSRRSMSRRSSLCLNGGLALGLAGLLVALPLPAAAENLKGALLRAFAANPSLNAERAGSRAARELIPQAQAKYWPKISASADTGYSAQSYQGDSFGSATASSLQPRGYGLQLAQTLFDGNRTANSVRLAGSQAEGATQALRSIEQTTLLDAASSYTAVLRDRDIVDLNRRSTAFLGQQLDLVSARHAFGDVTRADVAQATARRAAGALRLSAAQQQLLESSALYRQVIGIAPEQLTPPRPADQLVPRTFEIAMATALRTHPAVLSAEQNVAASRSQVDIVNGEFLPTFSVTAAVSRRSNGSVQGDRQVGGSVIGQLSIPIFEGGDTFSRSRQARQVAGQRLLQEDAARDQVRATLTASWGQLMASKTQFRVATTQFEAANHELSDATAQYRYGQKSLIDVLNAQQDLLDAGTSLITARRDRVVATFAVARATGQLTLEALGGDLDDRGGRPTAGSFAAAGDLARLPAMDPALRKSLMPQACAACAPPARGLGLRASFGAPLAALSDQGMALRATMD